MTPALPKPIAAYFDADRGIDAEAVLRCFTEDAVVRDERRVHAGIDAIRRWKAAAAKAYSYTVEPFAVALEDGRVVVTSRLDGDFPGSPLDLRYAFVISDDGRIADLEIRP